jgi:hypothetical protein
MPSLRAAHTRTAIFFRDTSSFAVAIRPRARTPATFEPVDLRHLLRDNLLRVGKRKVGLLKL